MRPPLTPQRSLEDFGFLADPTKRTDFWDPLKFVPLTSDGHSYLTLGFEYRSEYEWYNNANWGAGPQDGGGYVLQRLMPLVDFHLGDHFRIFSQLQYDTVSGRNGGPRPGIDADRGDLHEAFLDVGTNLHAKDGPSLRIGRQELVLGSGRLVDNNEGVNVKLSFDGVRLTEESGPYRVITFALRPVELTPGRSTTRPTIAALFGAFTALS